MTMHVSQHISTPGPFSLLDFIELLWPGNREQRPGWKAELTESYKSIVVTGLCSDSRSVQPGDVFIALAGERVDGLAYAEQAIRAGAVGVLSHTEEESLDSTFDLLLGCPIIRVSRLSHSISELAAYFYGYPSRQMTAIGVTGTNGKTSIACLLASLLSQLQGRVGIIGTLGYGVFSHAESAAGEDALISNQFDRLQSTGYTTPDAITTQQCLAQIARLGCQSVVMEVSSHALAQRRVEAVSFSIAILSNISRDHLDFHGSMEAYAAAKRRLFEFDSVVNAVVNLDDTYVRRFLPEISEGLTVLSYSLKNAKAALYADSISYSDAGSSADIHYQGQCERLHCGLLGQFNLENCLAAIATLLLMGFDLENIVECFSSVRAVPGRMQRVLLGSEESGSSSNVDIGAIVDYAHTPDALELALAATRQHAQGDLICVFGCGGNRDVGKRSLMGSVAVQAADKLYLTSDNPRDEDPELIVKDICQGIKGEGSVVIDLDRESAIAKAIRDAKPGALVLIAGKGHESEQIVKGHRYPLSDYQIARRELLKRVAA